MRAVFCPLRGFTGLNVTFILNLTCSMFLFGYHFCITFVLSNYAVDKYAVVLLYIPAQCLGIVF